MDIYQVNIIQTIYEYEDVVSTMLCGKFGYGFRKLIKGLEIILLLIWIGGVAPKWVP
jgi:hypothetical protein